jgi:hypothetical protein
MKETMACALAAVVLFASCNRAISLEYKRVGIYANQVYIELSGAIELNDEKGLSKFLMSLPLSDQIVGYSLNSPGGNVHASGLLADMISRGHLGDQVVVLADKECASACFLLFAAGKHKYAVLGSKIGVHRARRPEADFGKGFKKFEHERAQDIAAFESTGGNAQMYGRYGVSPSIIGKMMLTKPGEMTWLTAEDLTEMGAIYIRNRNANPLTRPGQKAVK